MQHKQKIRIVIVAKCPQAGKVKTRLVPALGAEGAATLARQLLQYTLQQSLATLQPVELCGSPALNDPCWQALHLPDTLQRSNQQQGDLGARMSAIVQRVLQHTQAVLLIGSDCPALDTAMLNQAAQQLQQHDAVIIPASDGGYVLLGLRQFSHRVFEDMAWSTSEVCEQTLQRLDALGWSVAVLPTQHDIDEPEDLLHLGRNFSLVNSDSCAK